MKGKIIFYITLISFAIISLPLLSQNKYIIFKDGTKWKESDVIEAVKDVKTPYDKYFIDRNKCFLCLFHNIAKYYTVNELVNLMKIYGDTYMDYLLKNAPKELVDKIRNCYYDNLFLLKAIEGIDTTENNDLKEKYFIETCKQDFSKFIKNKNFTINGTKFCSCVYDKLSSRTDKIDLLNDLTDPNSVLFNEVYAKCYELSKNDTIRSKTDDIISDIKSEYIDLIKLDNIFKIKVNIGDITKYFIIDSGANDVVITSELESILLEKQIVKNSDFIDDYIYEYAGGKKEKCRRFILNNVNIGNFYINNVVVAVSMKGTMLLLGKSLLDKFKKWSINNEKSTIYLERQNDNYNNSLNKTNYEDFYKQGLTALDNKDYSNAIELFTKALDIEPQNDEILLNRGIAYYNLKQYQNAIYDYNKVIEITSGYASVYFDRGLAYYHLEDYNNAINDYSKAIYFKPDKDKYYFYRGLAYNKTKDYANAYKDYSKVIELKSDYEEAYYNRGLIKKELGDIISACLDWEKAKELGDKDVDYLINKYCNK